MVGEIVIDKESEKTGDSVTLHWSLWYLYKFVSFKIYIGKGW